MKVRTSRPNAAGKVSFFREVSSRLLTPRLRSLGEFAEQEIILPDGPYAGRRFRLDRHPVAPLLFAELDSGKWQRAFVTGPNMDGKSLLGFVIPTCHLLFERQETVILGVPSLEMVADKWTVDLLPVIRASRYADQLPSAGRGSRDGESVLFEFRNGARLRFMTAGGGDQARAGFSSKNLVVTETDGFDEVGGKSREGDKFSQLARRLLAHGTNARLLAECTVSTEEGRTWREYQAGTRSRIALPCPHCGEYVTPEREHFTGWQAAEDEPAAVAAAHVVCPECGTAWTNDQRIEANRRGVLVHRGQTVASDGTIAGEPPRTNTLGFRWSVVNTVLNPGRLSMVGGIEWAAQRAANEDAAETDLRQSQWALPAAAAKASLSQFDSLALMGRQLAGAARGVCPEDTVCVTVACDVGKWLCHWTALAWRPHATPHVVDYGRLEVPSADMSEEEAILLALRAWRDETVNKGWMCRGTVLTPAVRMVDSGEWQDVIQTFVGECAAGWFATKGYGLGQRRGPGGRRRDTGSVVVGTGDHYNQVRLPTGRTYVEIDADHWKGWLHARLHTPVGQPGAMTLFQSNDHLSFCKHLTAEKRVEEFVPKEGMVTRWEAVSRNNHWLDATTLACVGGHAAGMRLLADTRPADPQRAAPQPGANVEYSSWLTQHKRW